MGSGVEVSIPYYANTSFHKEAFARSGEKNANTVGNFVSRDHTIFWRSTAAITSIDLECLSGNFEAGSIATLYALA